MQSWLYACVAVSGVRSAEGWQLEAAPYPGRTALRLAGKSKSEAATWRRISHARLQRSRVCRVGGSGLGVDVRFGGRSMRRAVTARSPSSLRNRYGDRARRSKGPISMARNPFGGRVGGWIDEADVVFVGAVVSVFQQLLISDQSRRELGVPQEKWTVMRDAVLECLGLKLGENGVFFVSLGDDEHSMRSLFLSPLPATWKKPLKPQCGRMAGQIF